MGDFEKEKFYPSTENLTRLRNAAVFYLAGGLILAALRIAAGKLVFALAGGGIISAVGIGWLMANNPRNKKTGALITGVGILVMLSGVRVSLLPVLTATALSIITVGSLVLGVKNLIMYFIAQSRHT
jgi:hypothetical protein